MAARHGVNGRTKYHIDSYLKIRREGKEDKYHRSELRGWLASIATQLTEEELRCVLIEVYHNIRPHSKAVEVLSNINILDIQDIETSNLKFKDNGLNGSMRVVQD